MASKLEQHKEQAFLSKQLATVAYDAPIETSSDHLYRRPAEISLLKEVGEIMAGRGGGLFDRLLSNYKKVLMSAD